MKSIWAVIKRNFAGAIIPLIITAAVVLLATTSADSEIALSRGNYTWLYLIMLPFFIVFGSFKKLIHLNASKKSYFLGSMATYVLAALAVSSINTIIHLTVDHWNQTQTVINLIELCGWWQNGVVVAFLQQFVFLLMCSIFLHVLLSIQPYWYGWLTDAAVIAVISVFTPIASLRAALAAFFGLIMFNSVAWLHILVCVVGCAAFYMLGLAAIKQKSI